MSLVHCLASVLLVLTIVSYTQAIQCYACNSALDPDCEEFDEDVFEDKFKVDCTEESRLPKNDELDDVDDAVGCRKMKQEVAEKVRTVRECAYSGNNVDGLKRTGNKGVRLFYYQCDDEDLCNAATASTCSTLAVIFLAIVALLRH